MRLFSRIRSFFHIRRFITKLMILYSVLIVAVLLFSSIFFYVYYHRTLEERTLQYTLENLNQMQYNIEINLEQVEQLSMILVSNDTIQNYLPLGGEAQNQEALAVGKEVEKLCIDVMVSRNDIESVSVYTDQGNFAGTNMSDQLQGYYDAVKVFAAEYRGRLRWLYMDAPEPSILAARTIYSTRTLEAQGLLVIKYRQSSISRIIAGALKNGSGSTYVLDNNGRIIACPDKALQGGLFAGGLEAVPHEQYVKADIYGVPSMATQLDSGYNRWRYIGTIPESALRVSTSSLFLLVLIAMLCSSALGVAFSGIIARGVTKPVNQLTAYLQHADIEDLHLARYESRDEFSFLFQSYNEMLQRLRQLIETNYKQKILQNEMEIKMLHMQINPHFLYNTLDTVYYMALDGQNKQIEQMIKPLADMMRYSVSGGKSVLSIVRDDVRHAENYCAVQKIRMGDKLEYYFDIEEELMNQTIPRLTFQPFVENCILHGFSGDPAQVLSLEVVGFRQEDCCMFQISDDGVGLSEATCAVLGEQLDRVVFSDTHGIALPNINAQIRKLFGEKFGVSFEAHNENGGATFTIVIPFVSEREG